MDTLTRLAVAVDPDAIILELLAVSLDGEGFRVAPFTSGEDALKFIHGTPPELLVLDVGPGSESAWALLEQLSGPGATAAIPALLWSTAPISDADMAQLHPRRVATLHKPFDLDDLIAQVHSLTS